MSTKSQKELALRLNRLNLDEINSAHVFNLEQGVYTCYNEFVAAQIKKIPETILAFFQYEGGDDAMYYMQLLWMSEFSKQSKNQPS